MAWKQPQIRQIKKKLLNVDEFYRYDPCKFVRYLSSAADRSISVYGSASIYAHNTEARTVFICICF